MTRVSFLGFGEAARAFRGSLSETGQAMSFAAYDIKLKGPECQAMQSEMLAAGVECRDAAAALGDADWLISAVTADQSLAAVEPLLTALGPGTTLIDVNSVSPERKRQTAARVEATGAGYLDMAVMAPVHPRGHRTPVLVAGHALGSTRDFLDGLGFDWHAAGDRPGDATAVKMVRSVFVKGLEAITAEALVAAERSGCLDTILESLSASYPGLGWPDHAAYVFDRTLIHGARRAAEMRESAATLAELGLTASLAEAIADVQDALGAVRPNALVPGSSEEAVHETISRVSAARPPRDA